MDKNLLDSLTNKQSSFNEIIFFLFREKFINLIQLKFLIRQLED